MKIITLFFLVIFISTFAFPGNKTLIKANEQIKFNDETDISSDASNYFVFSKKYIKSNKNKEAIKELRKLVKIDSNNPYAFLLLSYCSYSINENKEMSQYFNKSKKAWVNWQNNINENSDNIKTLEKELNNCSKTDKEKKLKIVNTLLKYDYLNCDYYNQKFILTDKNPFWGTYYYAFDNYIKELYWELKKIFIEYLNQELSKNNYLEAIKTYDYLISINNLNSEYYSILIKRSELKRKIGDNKGSNEDFSKAIKIKDRIEKSNSKDEFMLGTS